MSQNKSFKDRLADQAAARKKLLERAQEMAARAAEARDKSPSPQAAQIEALTADGQPQQPPASPPKPACPWTATRMADGSFEYAERESGLKVRPQPWARDLTNVVLQAADRGGVTLCLTWPGVITGLPLLHALANAERWFAGDLRGFRTLFFPGSYTSRAALQGILAQRSQAADLYLSLLRGTTLVSPTSSPAFEAALVALNNIRNTNPDLPNPSLAEFVPVFVFDAPEKRWVTTASVPLERTLSKVGKLSVGRGSAGASAFRNDLKQKVGAEWGSPELAPSALMVMHHSTRREAWIKGFCDEALRGAGRPTLLLLDATQAALSTNYAAVKNIPPFIKAARENGLGESGAVVVTDDPKTYFALRARLLELKIEHSTRVWAAEGDSVLLASKPVADTWKPPQRSNSNFTVHIVDHEASQVALLFQRLLSAASDEATPAHKAVMAGYSYVLRLSNMPAGYTDLTAFGSESGAPDFNSQLNAWTPVVLNLRLAVESGVLGSVRDKVEKAIGRAEELINAWGDATPMATRLLGEIRKHAGIGKEQIAIVLPSKRYVLLAHRFLKRKLGEEWAKLESRVHWHVLSSVAKTLSENREKHFVFVGINRDVLRILITHQDVPHGTAVMVSYRHAVATVQTLAAMRTLDAFKPYRGRLGLLEQELDRRIKEIPNGIDIGRMKEVSLTFRLDDDQTRRPSGEQSYYAYQLEGGNRAYASGWIYKYVPDEDPPFRRAPASAIQRGDFVFDMGDELRAKLESSLQINAEGFSSIVDPVRMLLKLYHDDVRDRCARFFKSKKRSALAREIYARMLELDEQAKACRPGRVYYWLDLGSQNDSRPHAAKDARAFKVFCHALEISDETAAEYWGFVKQTRRLNQYLGRELVARYAEILFHPESAMAYRKVPQETIRALQQDALQCVYRVEAVTPPSARAGMDQEI